LNLRPLLVALLLALTLTHPAAANDPIAKVQAALDGMKTLGAGFEQMVQRPGRGSPEMSKGKVWWSRPWKFRWVYETPEPMELIGDGSDVAWWDVLLEQITIEPKESVGSTVAALLSGDVPLRERFDLRDAGESRVTLVPKKPDPQVVALTVVLKEGRVAEVTIVDPFQVETTVRFERVDLNPEFPKGCFEIKIPEGVSVQRGLP